MEIDRTAGECSRRTLSPSTASLKDVQYSCQSGIIIPISGFDASHSCNSGTRLYLVIRFGTFFLKVGSYVDRYFRDIVVPKIVVLTLASTSRTSLVSNRNGALFALSG